MGGMLQIQVPSGTDSIGNGTDDIGTGTGTGEQPTKVYVCTAAESKLKSVTYVNRVHYLT